MANKFNPAEVELENQLVALNRVSKTVKGGRISRFAALMVVGDKNGHVINLIEDSAYNFGVRLKALRPDVTFITYSYPWQQDVLSMGVSCIVHDFNTLARKTVQLLKDQLEGRQIRSQRVPFIFRTSPDTEKSGE